LERLLAAVGMCCCSFRVFTAPASLRAVENNVNVKWQKVKLQRNEHARFL
jgi:hypothetical protein